MDNNIGERIGQLIEKLEIKKNMFAQSIKVDQSYVTQLVNGKRTPSDRLIADICRKYDVDELWLRYGKNEMFVLLEENEIFDKICTEIQFSNDNFIKSLIQSYWNLSEEKKMVIRELIDSISSKKNS